MTQKNTKSTLIYDISYKTSTGAKPLRVMFVQIRLNGFRLDGFIKIHDGIRYFVLFDCGWFDKICDRIKYLIGEKMVLLIILIIILQESKLVHTELSTEKIWTSHNVTILINSIVNKNENNYYYNTFSEKGY